MAISAAEQLILDFKALQLDLLQPVELTLQQAQAILDFRNNPDTPNFRRILGGTTLATFKECSAREITEWHRQQKEAYTNERATVFGGGDDDDYVFFPDFLQNKLTRFTADVEKIQNFLFQRGQIANSVCHSGLFERTRDKRLHVDRSTAYISRLDNLPLRIINPERRDEAEARIRELYAGLDPKIKDQIRETSDILDEASTNLLHKEGLMIDVPFGHVALAFTGKNREWETELVDGTGHSSTPVERPTPSTFFRASIRRFFG